MSSPTLEVRITSNVDDFTAGMKRATQAVKEFTEACKLIPWYMRWYLAAQALLTSKRG